MQAKFYISGNPNWEAYMGMVSIEALVGFSSIPLRPRVGAPVRDGSPGRF